MDKKVKINAEENNFQEKQEENKAQGINFSF